MNVPSEKQRDGEKRAGRRRCRDRNAEAKAEARETEKEDIRPDIGTGSRRQNTHGGRTREKGGGEGGKREIKAKGSKRNSP